MTITSTAFQNDDPIPPEYGRKGKNINPPLTFSEIPDGAKSLVLIVEDPDAPSGTFAHWILYDISPATLQILEGQLPMGAKQATNDFGQNGYGGPQSPSGTHRYHFKLFALDVVLAANGREPQTRQDLYPAMDGHVLEQTELVGTFTAQE